MARRQWSAEVLDALEIDPEWLPRGPSRPTWRGSTHGGVPVAAGAGDQAAGALGVGVVAEGGPASVVLGTSGVVFAALDHYAADPEGRVHAFCHAVPGAWHVMGVMLSAAGSLRWLRDTIGGDVTYDDLIAGAERWEPGVEGLLFAPYLAGERTPHPDPDARGAFLGLGLRHDRGAMTRAVLEGVAFGLRDALDLVVEMGGRPASGRVSGGGGRGMLWLEIVASVLGIPLELTLCGRGRRLRRGAARRRRGGRVGRRARGRRHLRAGDAHDRAAARLDGALRRAAAGVPARLPGTGGGARGLTGASLCGVRRPCLVGPPCGFLHDCALSCGVWPPYENCWGRSAARRSSAASRARGRSARRT